MIDTASNTVVAAVATVPNNSEGVAVTPDGKHAYVANEAPAQGGAGTVSVIDTATNTIVATVGVGIGPYGVGIVPPVGVPFLAFNAQLEIDLDRAPKEDHFELLSSFTLSSTAPAIHPVTELVTLQVATSTTTIPPRLFHEPGSGFFTFHGVIDGVTLEALIKRTGTLRYAFEAKARYANLTGTVNPVPVTLTIGDDTGTTSVNAHISR